MLNSGKSNAVAEALMGKMSKPAFAPKSKGNTLSTVPSVNPALKALAFNRRKRTKIG